VPRSDHVHKRTIRVAKAGSDVGTRNRINLIEGSNVTLTVADDSGGDGVDVTIAVSGATELVVADGIIDPPEPVWTEDGADFVYAG
jgi:hypothetical protein